MILICTYGRSTKQTTWDQLPEVVRERTTLVVQHRERHLYQEYPLLVLPPGIQTLPDTRQWLTNNLRGYKCIQLDDDLVFATRRADEPTKFRPSTGVEIEAMFEEMYHLLDTYAHVGVSGREGANRDINAHRTVTRQMRIHGYRLDVLKKEKITQNTMPDVEDFHTTLQLLELGYPNILINWIVHNQEGSNTEGGCSEYRTLESHARDVEILREHHPSFVKVVTKKTKTAWGGGERKDVIIQWKKAYTEGMKEHGTRTP